MNYYEILNLNIDASPEDIRKSYKKLILQYHPDKNGGLDDKFKEVQEAYQILSCPQKRKLYNMTIETTGSQWEQYKKVLHGFFAYVIKHWEESEEISNMDAVNNPPRKPDIVLSLHVTLEQLYKGEHKKVVFKTRRLNSDVVQKTLLITLVDVQPKYIFENEGDEYEPGKFGNVVVNVHIQKHPYVHIDTTFSRFDLRIEYDISLYDYIWGIDHKIPFFNNEELHIKKKFQPESYFTNLTPPMNLVHIVDDHGLPYNKGEEVAYGNLYIFYRLRIPIIDDKQKNDESFQSLIKNYFKINES